MKWLLIFFLLNPDGSVSYNDTGEAYKNPKMCAIRQVHQSITQPVNTHRVYFCIRVIEI